MAGNVGIIGGTLYLTVNGQSFDLVGSGWKVSPVNKKVTSKPLASGGIGLIVENVSVMFEGSLADTGKLAVQSLYGLSNIPCTLELANGKVYTMRKGTFTDSPSIDVTQGEIPIKIEDSQMIEQTA